MEKITLNASFHLNTTIFGTTNVPIKAIKENGGVPQGERPTDNKTIGKIVK